MSSISHPCSALFTRANRPLKLSQHLQKLRRNAPAGDAAAANGPKTPKGKGAIAKASSSAKSTVTKGKRKLLEDAGATDDVEEADGTPTKKRVKQQDPTVKSE